MKMIDDNWMDIQKLSKALGCSDRTINELKNLGVLIPGVHFYAVGNGTIRGKHMYSLEDCRAALLERTAELAKKKAKAEQIKPAETYSDSYLNELISRRCKA